MAELRGGTTIAGYRALHEGLSHIRLTGKITIGLDCTATGDYSFATGIRTAASQIASYAEGYETTSSGRYGSHSEGMGTTASGMSSHAEGTGTQASGSSSHAQNYYTVASGSYQTAMGKYNVSDTTNALIIGNGTGDTARSNALTVDWNGNLTVAGSVIVDGVDLKLSVSNGKTDIAAAITGKGVSASGSDTFGTLATKIGNIIGGSGNDVTSDKLLPKRGSGSTYVYGLVDTAVSTDSGGLTYSFEGMWGGHSPWHKDANAMYYFHSSTTNGGLLKRLDMRSGSMTETRYSGMTFVIGWFYLLDGYSNRDFAVYDNTNYWYRTYDFNGTNIYNRTISRNWSSYPNVARMEYTNQNDTVNKSWGNHYLIAWGDNYAYTLRYYDGYPYAIHYDGSWGVTSCTGRDDMVYIMAQSGNSGYIRKENYSGTYYWQSSIDLAYGTSTATSYISGSATDSSHNIYIACTQYGGSDNIQKFNSSGTFVWEIDCTSYGNPEHITVTENGPNGAEVLIVGHYQRVVIYDLSGNVLTVYSLTENGTGRRHYIQAVTNSGDIATWDYYDVHRLLLAPGTYTVR